MKLKNILNGMKNLWINQAHVKGFDCKTIAF